MAYHYSFQEFEKETMARSSAANLPISLKKTVETLNAIRGQKVSSAINYLERVSKEEAVVPYRRYNQEMAHKRGRGIATGGFPINVAKAVLKLLKSAQKNASEQEISGEIRIISASARKGSTRYHYGRYSGRKQKATNVEIVVGVRKWLREKL